MRFPGIWEQNPKPESQLKIAKVFIEKRDVGPKVRPFIPCAGLSGSLQRTFMSNAKTAINQSLLNYISQRASRWLFLTQFEKKIFFQSALRWTHILTHFEFFFSKCVEFVPNVNPL